MGSLVLGYSTEISWENPAGTDSATFPTANFPLVSWEEMMTELAVVSLANSLWSVCSESGIIRLISAVAALIHHWGRSELNFAAYLGEKKKMLGWHPLQEIKAASPCRSKFLSWQWKEGLHENSLWLFYNYEYGAADVYFKAYGVWDEFWCQ